MLRTASFSFLLAALILVLLPQRFLSKPVSNCPRNCKCIEFTEVTDVLSVDCTPGGTKKIGPINHIPDDLPANVTHLTLDFNVIDHLSKNVFFMYKRLQSLSIRKNLIKSIGSGSFAGLNQLKDIDLSGNEIESIDEDVFRDVPKLERLQLQNNRLKVMPKFATLPALKAVNLGLNNITDCTFPAELASAKLQSVSLSGNNCTTLTSKTFASLANCKQLTSFSFTDTTVTNIEPNAFSSLSFVEDLDLSSNEQLSWTEIQKVVFPPKLKTLFLEKLKTSPVDLDKNYVDFLPTTLENLKLSYCGFTGTMPDFRHLVNVTFLSVEGNEFTTLPKNAGGGSGLPLLIQHFYARNNKIQLIPENAFAGLLDLQSVDLSLNHITSFSPRAFGVAAPSVTDLLLTQAIKRIPKGLLPTLPNLERLILDSNYMGNLETDLRDDFDKLTKLSTLDMSANDLNELPDGFFSRLHKITHLILSSNNLGARVSIDDGGRFFQGLESLTNLRIEENEIPFLPANVFSKIGRDLKQVDLLGNQLTRFPTEALANFSKLQIVNLDGNAITVLTPDQFASIPKTVTVNMWTNPFDCSCNNYEFLRWMDESKEGISRPSITELECHTPPELYGRAPPSASRLSASCTSSAGSTAAIVFFVVITVIVVVVLLAWVGARKLRHYFPYKRLNIGAGGVPQARAPVHMSGLDDPDDADQM